MQQMEFYYFCAFHEALLWYNVIFSIYIVMHVSLEALSVISVSRGRYQQAQTNMLTTNLSNET